MRQHRFLPPLAALFTTDSYRAPQSRSEPESPTPASLEQWELELGDERKYGLSSASGKIQILPPEY
jgi:hypothetical protein